MKKKKLVFKKGEKLRIQHKQIGEIRDVEVIRQLDDKRLLVVNEQDRDEIIELLEYIILILPLFERIIKWFRGLFKRRR